VYDLAIGHRHGAGLKDGLGRGGDARHGIGEIRCQGFGSVDGCWNLDRRCWRRGSITIRFCNSGCNR